MPFDPLLIGLLACPIYYLLVLIMHRFFSAMGVTIFMAVALIGANIQVLKLSYFSWFDAPVALGTALFSSTYFATDLLSEHYGKKKATQAIVLGFCAMVLMTLFLQITLAYPALSAEQSAGAYDWALDTHPMMSALFAFYPGIVVASLCAYLISQFLDVSLYQYIRGKTGGRWLFLRNNLSTWVSTLVDNTIFSLLAFWAFASSPVPLKELVLSYILGTYLLRMLYALLDTPFLYFSKVRWMLPKNDHQGQLSKISLAKSQESLKESLKKT